MNFEQLKYFQTVVRYGNITRAAKELHLTQPSLSKAISRLEQELGVQLFTRDASGIVLNEKGKIFSAYTDAALNGLQVCMKEINRQSHILLCVGTTCDFIMDMLLDTLQSLYLDLQVEGLVFSPSELPAALETGKAHLGFLPLPKQFQQSWIPLRPQKWCVAAHISHPLLRNTSPVTMESLADFPCDFCGSIETYEIIRQAFSRKGLSPQMFHEVDMNRGMSYLTSNQGFTFVPYDIVYGWFQARPNLQVGVLALDEPLLERDICVKRSLRSPELARCDAAYEFLCKAITHEWQQIQAFVEAKIAEV